jgi:hypothetical protein
MRAFQDLVVDTEVVKNQSGVQACCTCTNNTNEKVFRFLAFWGIFFSRNVMVD